MNTEIKQLLKGRWNYNIEGNSLICKNKNGLTYVFENKSNDFFQKLLSTLSLKSKPDPSLKADYEKPIASVSLELFHRVLRSNEVIFEQEVGLRECIEGLFCFSNVTKNFKLNHYKYDEENKVYIDPQRMCKITRKIRDRERVNSKIRIESKRIILECEFPWTVLTIIMPTIQK